MSGAHDEPDQTHLFAHPDPRSFDYKPLLGALRECRYQLVEFMAVAGPRNPVNVEAESLIAYIDAVALLTRVPNAAQFVRRERDDLRF